MNKNMKTILLVGLAVIVAAVGYAAFTAPDTRSTGEKVGDAIGKLDEGVDDAARELEDRTPAERIGDEIDDATDGSPE
jgi:hypothetical protein